MSLLKKIMILVLLVLLVFCFSSCQKSVEPDYESKYKQAVEMLAEGKYAEAASLLDGFGSYEEATKLSMYCRAVDAGDRSDYQSALTTFSNLSGYLNSDLMYSYYTARREMDFADDENYEPAEQYISAAKIFLINPLFRDSKELADVCYKSAYDYAKNLIAEKRYYQAINDLELLEDYLDSPVLIKQARADSYYDVGDLASAWKIYKDLDKTYQTHASDYAEKYKAAGEKKEDGQYAEAAAGFTELGDYEDSKSLCTECTYLYAKKLMDSAEYEKAEIIFIGLDGYLDSADLVTECRYLQAKALMASGSVKEATAAFVTLEEYKDSKILIRQIDADALFDEGKLADAWKIYADLDDEYRTHDSEYEERYLTAAGELENLKYDDARTHFLELGGYKDSANLARKCFTDKAEAYMAKGLYMNAISIYTSLEENEKVSKCHYLFAQKLLEDGKCVDAASQYSLCIDYKDSASKHFEAGVKAYEAGMLQDAFDIFKADPDAEAAKEMIYQIAVAASGNEEYAISTKAYEYVGVYKEALLEKMKDYYRWGNMLYGQGDFDESAKVFATLGDFSTAPEKVKLAGYSAAVEKMDAGDYAAAKEYLVSLGGYKDCKKRLKKCEYELAAALYRAEKYQEALDAFAANNLAGYEKTDGMIDDCHYHLGLDAENRGSYLTAVNEFSSANGCLDSADHLLECTYLYAVSLKENGKLDSAVEWFIKAEKHPMTVEQMESIIDYCEVTEQKISAEFVRQSLLLIHADNSLDAGNSKEALDLYAKITNPAIVKTRENEAWFRYGETLFEAEKYAEAIDAFTAAGDYEGAKICLNNTWIKIGNAEMDAGNYEKARIAYRIAGESELIKGAWAAEAEKFLLDKKYAEAKTAFANAGMDEKVKEVWKIEAERYLAESRYEEARAAYAEADMADGVSEVWNLEGEAEFSNGNYEKAKTAFNNAGNQERYEDAVFEQANALTAEGKYKEAYDLFVTICQREDVKAVLGSNPEFSAFAATKGEVITFGAYEQDGNYDNGPEPIEWIVLDIQEGGMLLLSKYGLASKPFCDTDKTNVWGESSLRKWLNEDFLYQAFSADEQAEILITEVDNAAAQGFPAWGPKDEVNTMDKIFLLSYREVYDKAESFGYPDMRVYLTNQAIQGGAGENTQVKTGNGAIPGNWWLRSPAAALNYATVITSDRAIGARRINDSSCCVRPALWLSMESDAIWVERKTAD